MSPSEFQVLSVLVLGGPDVGDVGPSEMKKRVKKSKAYASGYHQMKVGAKDVSSQGPRGSNGHLLWGSAGLWSDKVLMEVMNSLQLVNEHAPRIIEVEPHPELVKSLAAKMPQLKWQELAAKPLTVKDKQEMFCFSSSDRASLQN